MFVFVVLALLLFYPLDRSSIDSEFDRGRGDVTNLAGKIEDMTLANAESDQVALTDEQIAALADVFLETEQLHSVTAYFRGEGDSMQPFYSFDRGNLAAEDTHELTVSEKSLIDTEMVRYVSERPVGCMTTLALSARHSVFYYHLANSGQVPAVMVSVINHDLIVSDRSSLMYLCFVLFLVSTLVSLLTVYLIRVRVKRPLARLMRGLEKTTAGELYYMIETAGDVELDQLFTAFNRMTHTLWEDQKKLKAYNTDLKKTNFNLVQSQLFLSTLIDSSQASVIVTSATGDILIFNRMASEVFGYAPAEATQKKITELFALPNGESDVEREKQGDEPGSEVRCRKSDGASFPAYVISSPISTGEDIMAHVYTIRDISESKGFLDMMIRLDRYYTRGEMVGDIAHEINNYLAILGGNAELLPLIIKRGNQEKLDKKLQLMRDTVDKIARFTDGLMDVPQDRVSLSALDLNQLVENVLAFLEPQNRFDFIKVETSLSSDLPLVELDAGQIQQLLTNLVFNAADVLKDREGEKVIRLETSRVVLDGEPYARLEVLDSGPGVEEQFVPKLFHERFTTKRKGHGIGLITCRRIIEGHHGRLTYEYSGGARFRSDLPLTPRPHEEAQAPVSEPDSVNA